jgi:hypothetical protein
MKKKTKKKSENCTRSNSMCRPQYGHSKFFIGACKYENADTTIIEFKGGHKLDKHGKRPKFIQK